MKEKEPVKRRVGRPKVAESQAPSCECCVAKKRLSELAQYTGLVSGKHLALEARVRVLEAKQEATKNVLTVLRENTKAATKEASESKLFVYTLRDWLVKKGFLKPLE